MIDIGRSPADGYVCFLLSRPAKTHLMKEILKLLCTEMKNTRASKEEKELVMSSRDC